MTDGRRERGKARKTKTNECGRFCNAGRGALLVIVAWRCAGRGTVPVTQALIQKRRNNTALSAARPAVCQVKDWALAARHVTPGAAWRLGVARMSHGEAVAPTTLRRGCVHRLAAEHGRALTLILTRPRRRVSMHAPCGKVRCFL